MSSRKNLRLASADQPVYLIKLRHLCRWIREANNEVITKCALLDFPKYIILEFKILPTDITNLFYVIRAAPPQDFTLEVDDCDFTADTLPRFWKEVAASKTKIRSFDLEWRPISDDDSSCIVESLQHVQKLRLFDCGVSRNLVRALSEKWEEIGTNIEELDLSGNEKIDDEGFVILARLPGIRRLELWGCDISSKGCVKFVDEMIKRYHKIEDLDLRYNEKIDDEGFVFLARLPGIRRLELVNCDISSKGCVEFVEEMIRTNHKIEELNLSWNKKIDDEGFVILARLPGIRRLVLWGCDISSKGCVEFAEEMIRSNHKLEYLRLNSNPRIDDDGARSLFRCFHLIEVLGLRGCGVTKAVKEETRSELRRLNLPENRVKF